MAIVLKPGMTVEGRRAIPNPGTVSGRPMLNTYEGLGIKSVAKELRTGRRRAGIITTNSRVKRKRHIPKGNLCHRLHGEHTIRLDRSAAAFNKCRTRGLEIDKCDDEHKLDDLLQEYELNLDILKEQKATKYIDDLLRRELARGSQLALRRL